MDRREVERLHYLMEGAGFSPYATEILDASPPPRSDGFRVERGHRSDALRGPCARRHVSRVIPQGTHDAASGALPLTEG